MWWEEYTTKVDKCKTRRKSGKGGKSIAGEGLCTRNEHRRSASVDEVPTDEVRSN